MINRRQFIKGSIACAMSFALPSYAKEMVGVNDDVITLENVRAAKNALLMARPIDGFHLYVHPDCYERMLEAFGVEKMEDVRVVEQLHVVE